MSEPVRELPKVAQESSPVVMSPAAEKLCRVCKKAMPAEGVKCTECSSFQNWRRILSFSTEILAMLIAISAVMGFAIPEFTKWLNRHSHTQVRIIKASEDDLVVILMNTGHEPSTVQKLRASFLNVPLTDADLFPADASEFYIPADSSHMVRLRPPRFTPKPGSDVAAVKTALRRGTLKFIADIKESTDEGATDKSQQSIEYPTENLSPWVTTYILPIE
jgi:predicted nucleic acid-binding Zn ribbon protein